MLIRISRSELFTTIWRIPPKMPDEQESPLPSLTKNALYKTMSDCELVLRFFTIKEVIQSDLRGTPKKLLDQCMLRHLNNSPEESDRQEKHFTACLSKLFQTFDHKPFVLPATNKLSRPLYDALMVATRLNEDFDPTSCKPEIVRRLNDCLSDAADYDILVGRANTVETIKERVRLAEHILLGRERVR